MNYKDLLTDDQVLDVLILIEAKDYIGGMRMVREITGMQMQQATQLLKMIAKKELNQEILKTITIND